MLKQLIWIVCACASIATGARAQDTTEVYYYNMPTYTGYTKELDRPRTIIIPMLAKLTTGINPFAPNTKYEGRAEFPDVPGHSFPISLISKGSSGMAELTYSLGFGPCVYPLQTLGKDEKDFLYFKPKVKKYYEVKCVADAVVRVEMRRGGDMRMSSHQEETGVEQWAVILKPQ